MRLLDQVISYGPCQFPTLGFVVERWARIQTFVKEDFWFLDMTIRLNADGSVVNNIPAQGMNNVYSNQQQGRAISLTWKRVRLYDRTMTLAIYDACLEAGEAVVTDVSGRPKNKWRPVPLATVELQKRASKYLRIGSEQLMQKAESLYNNGYISYPRTETEKFRPEFNHHDLIQSFHAVNGEFGNYARLLLSNNNFQTPRAGPNDDNAHPPITPAKAVNPEEIADPIERKIYSLVVKHYLACCSRDAVGRETELTLKIASEEFSAKGLMILERNWLEIYHPWEKWSTGQGELPKARVGTRITPTSLMMRDGATAPPSLISEVELISVMDKNGIGTDATIAQHITTILDRGYCVKDGSQRFSPNPLGIALVEGYNSMGHQLNKPDLRRSMEAECNAIADGRKTKEAVLGSVVLQMLQCFNEANAKAAKLDEAMERHFGRLGTGNSQYSVLQGNFSRCGNCNGMMTLKQHRSSAGPNQNPRNNNQAASKIVHCQTCSQAHMMPKYHSNITAHFDQGAQQPTSCPICKFQVLTCESDNGKSYPFCPNCFNNPPANHGGSPTLDFPCSNCTHHSCSLATGVQGGDVEVYPCPFCTSSGNAGGRVLLKRSDKVYRLACSNGGRDACQYTVWLPRQAREITLADSSANVNRMSQAVCQQCTNQSQLVRKLRFVWKQGAVPPHYGYDQIACVLCDSEFRGEMQVRLPSMNQVNPRRTGNTSMGRGRGRASSSNNSVGRRGGRGGRSYNNQGRGRGGGRNSYNNSRWN